MNRAILATAVSAFALIASAPAFAQDSPAPVAPAQDEGEIVVTAQLRSQRLIDVPMALTAYNGEFLDELGLNEFEDLSRFVPGFEVQNQSPNNPGFVMRGITSDTGTSFGEPRVSVYQDGVSISKSRGSYVELFDIERVEIARGPQSTLYGRGALIGAVNIIQNRADPDEFQAMVRGAYGNLDYVQAEGMVNVPLGSSAAFRVSGRYRNRDGFIGNLLGGEDFNSVDTAAIRGTIRIEPSSRISIDVFANYQEDHPAGTSFKSMSFSPTDPATGAVLGTRDPWTAATLAPGAGFEGGAPLGLDREVWGVTGIVRWDLSDSFNLTSLTAYREFESTEIFDADGISLPALTAAEHASGEQFSQELRLTYDNEGPLTAFLGLSYFTDEGFQRTPAQFDERVLLARLAGVLQGPIPGRPATDPAPISIFSNTAFTGALLQGVAASRGYALAPGLAQAIAANLKPGHYETAINFADTNAFDIFADVTFQVSDQFELGAGIRYSHDRKNSAIGSSVLNGRSILGGFIGALGQPEPTRTGLLTALAAPGAANIPQSALYPVPLFGLGFQPTIANGLVESAQLNDSGFSWRFTARYEPGPDSSIYASYARGRRPEILSALTPATPFGAARFDLIDSETVDSFEVGARTQTLGRTLFLDASVFYYRYNNFQTIEQQGVLFVTTNAGQASAYGFEAQMRWRASPNATLFATYAFNHSRFDTGVRDGNRFRLSPDHTLSLGAALGVDIGPGRLNFTPSLTYQSRVFFDDDNDRPDLQAPPNALVADILQEETQSGYVLANARLGYTLNERFSIEAFVSNLFDENYIKDAGNTGDAVGFPTFIAGEPRLYGVQATMRF
jgi:iron complex outermembrane receptor protein